MLSASFMSPGHRAIPWFLTMFLEIAIEIEAKLIPFPTPISDMESRTAQALTSALFQLLGDDRDDPCGAAKSARVLARWAHRTV